MATFAVPLRSDRWALLGAGPLTVDAAGNAIRLITRTGAAGAPNNSVTSGSIELGGNPDSDDNRYAYAGTENVWARLTVEQTGAVPITVLKEGATSANVAPFLADRTIRLTCDQDGAVAAPGLLAGLEAANACTVTDVAVVTWSGGVETVTDASAGSNITLATGCTINVAADGSYTLTAGAAWDALKQDETSSHTIELTITDGTNSLTDKARVTFIISGVNDGPSVTARSRSVNTGATVTANLLTLPTAASHPQGEAMHLARINGKPFAGNMPIETAKGIITPKGDGTFTYEPTISLAQGATDTDVITFALADRWGRLSPTRNLTITITGA